VSFSYAFRRRPVHSMVYGNCAPSHKVIESKMMSCRREP